LEKHSIELLGFILLEPGSFISDIIMAVSSYYFYCSIKKIAIKKSQNHLAYFFLFMAFSSFTGAFAHGFFLYTGKSLHYLAWILTGISVFFMEFSIYSHILKRRNRNLYLRFIKIKLLVFFIIITFFLDFIFVKINTAFGLLVLVFPMLLYQYFKMGLKGYKYVLSGIVLSVIPALLHRTKLEFAGIFNMNDLSHFFLILCLSLIYLGFKLEIIKYQYKEGETFSIKLNS
jgi:hypothetical protein